MNLPKIEWSGVGVPDAVEQVGAVDLEDVFKVEGVALVVSVRRNVSIEHWNEQMNNIFMKFFIFVLKLKMINIVRKFLTYYFK